MSDLITVVQRHLGRPWSAAGFNCWEFVRAVYYDAHGLVLPFDGCVQVSAQATAHQMLEADRSAWEPIAQPIDGAVVLLGRRSWPHHCGVWLAADGGLVAHNEEHIGVHLQRLSSLRAQGWGFIEFHRYRSLPCRSPSPSTIIP